MYIFFSALPPSEETFFDLTFLFRVRAFFDDCEKNDSDK
jgi:hypothetical protein